jgi:hypothetical protein
MLTIKKKTVDWSKLSSEELKKVLPEEVSNILGKKVQCKSTLLNKILWEVELTIESTKEVVAYFRLGKMYGCSAILISHKALVSPNFRGLGIGKLCSYWRICFMRTVTKSEMILCTSTLENDAQNSILEELGWKPLQIFKNEKSGNDVILWCINFNSAEMPDFNLSKVPLPEVPVKLSRLQRLLIKWFKIPISNIK